MKVRREKIYISPLKIPRPAWPPGPSHIAGCYNEVFFDEGPVHKFRRVLRGEGGQKSKLVEEKDKVTFRTSRYHQVLI